MSGRIEIAVVGDPHGDVDQAIDGPALAGFPLRLCTGDLTPNRGRERFDDALRIARELHAMDVHCVLGNHDGPTGFTGRSFPRSWQALHDALGPHDVSMRRVEMPELGLTLVGARPLSMGGSQLKHVPPSCADWSLKRWADGITELLLGARGERIVVLAHDGPTGLGAAREDIYGCDFRAEQGDWGDEDLRIALDRALAAGKPIVAVIAGHMHHALRGGGIRTSQVREGSVLHVNAAVVPRATPRGRALTIVTLDGLQASARIEWLPPSLSSPGAG